MPINKFYVNFATSFGPFKPTKCIKRNQKYAHRFPQLNFDQCHLWLLGSYTAHMALEQCFPFQEDQHEGGPSYGMMPTHTQPAV